LSDSLTAVTKAMSHMMQIGVKLAAPVMVIGFLGYVVFGIFNRMIPQLHVFFISLPVSIGVGLIILGISLAGVVTLIGQELEKNAILFGA
ncbi:MAG: flagellar biosynthetic protein FliR, partial [Alphaproteobacteria bacterium]|nr:flagellar biosynthetic protein FliR [Alphaproteobacteria bacterium]